MFLGHFGVAFGAKKGSTRVSLGTYIIAAQFVDLLWPILLLLGVEHVAISPGVTVVTPLDFYDYPFTHSLLMGCVWALLFGGGHYMLRRDRQSALLLGAVVLSHWLLDLIVHRPDLPLYPGDASRHGLGVWNSMPWTLALEFIFLGAGVYLYRSSTKAKSRGGEVGLWVLVLLMAGAYMGNLLGPTPTDPKMIAIGANLLWLFVLLGYWVDRRRSVV